MVVKFVCPFCCQEVEGEVYKGFNYPGDYIECSECEAEVEIEVKTKRVSYDEFWDDSVEDTLQDSFTK